MKLLLERGDVDVNSKDNTGEKPLSWAAWRRGHEAVMERLVGSDVYGG